MHRLLWLCLLAGCPAPSRYVVVDVTAQRVPVANALIAVDCQGPLQGAQRTDEDGRARVRVFDDGRDCSVLVAKPGYPTVLSGDVSVCSAGSCPPSYVDLAMPPIVAPLAPRISRPAPPREVPVIGRRPLEVAQ
jgi:hypothetical protein